jgi:hypothetical protein
LDSLFGKATPRILIRMLGLMALASVLTCTATSLGHTGDRPRISTAPDRLAADRALAARARHIDRASVGDTRVAQFLGAEFGMSETAIVAEKKDLGASWGDLTIAHTLAASDVRGMTAAQVFRLHDRGMGWGEVAAGLRFKLDEAVRAVDAESRVARGREKADGRTAPIRGDGI